METLPPPNNRQRTVGKWVVENYAVGGHTYAALPVIHADRFKRGERYVHNATDRPANNDFVAAITSLEISGGLVVMQVSERNEDGGAKKVGYVGVFSIKDLIAHENGDISFSFVDRVANIK